MKTKALVIVAGVVTAMIAMSAYAQSRSDNTQNFVKKAAVSNMFEIRSSEVALDKAQRQDVQNFAQMMIDDHTKADEQLKSAVSSANLKIQVPKTLDEKHQEKVNELQQTEADDFDEDYIEIQIDAHEKAVALFQEYSENGESDALRQFASKTLPVLRQHEDRIKQLDEVE